MVHDTLSPVSHGLLDYVTVVAFALAPTLFGFGGAPALVAYGLAGVHLLLTLATRFPMGMFDGVPLRAHGVVELLVSVALIVLPWVAGFVQPGAQWFYPAMGVLIFVVWLLSDYGMSGVVEGDERALEGREGAREAGTGRLQSGAEEPTEEAEGHGPRRGGRPNLESNSETGGNREPGPPPSESG